MTEPKRRALCIGINYPGTGHALAGCVNDANDWAAELDRRGYAVGLAVDAHATRDNLIGGMAEIIGAAKSGDRVVITYSGHGTWTPDVSGDELDGRDEAICPVDFPTAGLILDDDLYDVFSSARAGVRLVFVADSCFSGTIERFAPPIHTTATFTARRARFLPPAVVALDSGARPDLDALRAVAALPAAGRARRSALTLSACSDRQTTYDAVVDGRPCGIFSHVALSVLRNWAHPDPHSNPLTYRRWMTLIREQLPSVDYPDVTPQLDGTRTQRAWPVLT